MSWLAVHTNARKEGLVNDLLRGQGIETLYLHYRTTVKHARKKRVVYRPYFARYVFAQPGDIPLAAINRTIGVSTIVYQGDRPLVIPAPVIEELQARGNEAGRVQMSLGEKTERRRFNRGEQVCIVDGPMAGLFAVVALDSGREVRVWLEMFGGKVEALVDPEGLKSGSPAGGTIGISPRQHRS